MRQHLKKFFLGNPPEDDKHSINILPAHVHKIKRVWHGEDYEDFGMERIFRLLLICIKLLFPGIYLEHFFGRFSRTAKKNLDGSVRVTESRFSVRDFDIRYGNKPRSWFFECVFIGRNADCTF